MESNSPTASSFPQKRPQSSAGIWSCEDLFQTTLPNDWCLLAMKLGTWGAGGAGALGRGGGAGLLPMDWN